MTASIPVDQLSDITIYRSTGQVAGGGGQPTEVNSKVVDAQISIEQLLGGQKQRTFGKDEIGTWRGLVDADLDVQKSDLIEITSGRFQGNYFEIKSLSQPLGMIIILAMEKTNRRPN
jgi:hypothetical protein